MNLPAVLPDLSTLAGQTAHYAAVNARLFNSPPPKPANDIIRRIRLVRDRKIVFVEAKAPPPVNMLGEPHWRFLVAIVAMKHGVGVEDIMGAGRSVPFVAARHEVMYLMRHHTTYSLPRIGRLLGRDHSSVHHGIEKHTALLASRGMVANA